MALRELNIGIKMGGNAKDAVSELKTELDEVKENFNDILESTQLFSDEGAAEMVRFGQAIGDNIGGKGNSALSDLASKMGMSEKKLQQLIQTTRNDLKLDKEMKDAAKAVGLTDDEFKKLQGDMQKTSKTGNHIGEMLKAIGGIELVKGMASFASETFDAFKNLDKGRRMLQNLSGGDFPALKSAIDDTLKSSQGLSSEGGLNAAVNQALKMGASVDFIKTNLSGLQKAAAVTGADLSETMKQTQDFIISGSEEFYKKNGSIFAQYQDQIRAIQSASMSETAKKAAREKLVTEALRDNTELTKQYANYMQSAEAVERKYNERLGDVKEIIGELVSKAMIPLLKVGTSVLEWFTDSEDGANRVAIALTFLAPILGTMVVGALYSMGAAAWFAIEPLLPFIAIAAAVGAALAAVVLVVDDLITWMEGGESVIGEFLGPFKDFDLKKIFFGAINSIIALAKHYGKYIIMALFPVSAIYFFWDEIVDFITALPDKILAVFDNMTQQIKEMLRDVLPESFINGLKSIGIDFGESEKQRVNDAIITKDGKVIETHPDDNLIATKKLDSWQNGASQSKTIHAGQNQNVSIPITIKNITLGSGSTKDDADAFAAKVEEILNIVVAPKLRMLFGVPEEAV